MGLVEPSRFRRGCCSCWACRDLPGLGVCPELAQLLFAVRFCHVGALFCSRIPSRVMTSTATTLTPSPGTTPGMRTGEFCPLVLRGNPLLSWEQSCASPPASHPLPQGRISCVCPSGTGRAVQERQQPQPTTRSAVQALHTMQKLEVSNSSSCCLAWEGGTSQLGNLEERVPSACNPRADPSSTTVL